MKVTIHFDGGARPTNPGPVYGSFRIATDEPEEYRPICLSRWRQPFTAKTNNEAEYLTLWLALHEVIAKFPTTTHIQILSDSSLVVNQIRGDWKCRNERIRVLREKCFGLIQRIANFDPARWKIGWVPRGRMVSLFGH